jgi:hypothetical protein
MWRSITSVLIASMNKGLFVPACIFFLVLVMLLKTPSDYFPTLWKSFADYAQWGYILAAAAVTGWAINVRYLRRIHHNEISRMGTEKRLLQEQQHGHPMTTSNQDSL